MDRPVHRVNRREHMKQLYLRQRGMMMASTVRRLLERVRVHDGRSILHMDVRKKRNAAIVRNKEYRQQPLHIFNHRFPHPVLPLFLGQRYYNFFNCFGLCIFALLKQKRNAYELVT